MKTREESLGLWWWTMDVACWIYRTEESKMSTWTERSLESYHSPPSLPLTRTHTNLHDSLADFSMFYYIVISLISPTGLQIEKEVRFPPDVTLSTTFSLESHAYGTISAWTLGGLIIPYNSADCQDDDLPPPHLVSISHHACKLSGVQIPRTKFKEKGK